MLSPFFEAGRDKTDDGHLMFEVVGFWEPISDLLGDYDGYLLILSWMGKYQFKRKVVKGHLLSTRKSDIVSTICDMMVINKSGVWKNSTWNLSDERSQRKSLLLKVKDFPFGLMSMLFRFEANSWYFLHVDIHSGLFWPTFFDFLSKLDETYYIFDGDFYKKWTTGALGCCMVIGNVGLMSSR